MNDIDLTAIMKRENVRSIDMKVDQQGNATFVVMLRCGGHSGRGASVGEALDNAKALNADWLDVPWLRKVA